MTRARALFVGCLLALTGFWASAEVLPEEEIAALILAPYALGEAVNDRGVYQLLNSGGAPAGYVFQTEPLAPLPGFSGAAINILVVLDTDGRFLDVRLLDHNEPIFVSGLGEAPFHAFFEQYRGHSISESMVVGVPYGSGTDGGSLVYLDGVTKATASVRIAHESLLAATLAVAREKMQGIATGPPAFPDPTYTEALSWSDLVAEGIATHKTVTNGEVDALFDGTLWAHDDPDAAADPEAPYLDLWIVDLGPPSVAEAVLAPDTRDALRNFLEISPHDEPILVIETARHGLVGEDFVRNTAPAWLSAAQGGLPVALRDADLLVELHEDLPLELHDGVAMVLRTDRRLGFDPTAEWALDVLAVREHGMFQPEIGSVTLTSTQSAPERFFDRAGPIETLPPWREALINRQADLIALSTLLLGIVALLTIGRARLLAMAQFTPIRLGLLAVILGFVGWWGQGQLSIVTVMAVLRTAIDGGSWAFLLYDPFSLLIWVVTLAGLIAWGRGLFCGWLCPFGALQEFAHHIGRALRLPQIEPSAAWDVRLKRIKYGVLAALLATTILLPSAVDTAAEVEPFKTAITVYFMREAIYVAYAALWLLLGLVLFKGFCRYVCPLGAALAIGGRLRGRDWIARREACGSPCQLCKVRCKYGAIKAAGQVDYTECFQCLDCVAIHDDPKRCVPLVLAARGRGKLVAAE
ncbi:MAG: 4Fe-4S binding protein [Pseudomonadota bacterium]